MKRPDHPSHPSHPTAIRRGFLPVLLASFLLIAAGALLSAPVPAQAEEPLAGLYELRTYTAGDGKLEALHQRFRDHTLALFEKHGIRSVAYWTPEENHEKELVFLLAFPDKEAHEHAWKSFLEDPEWQRVAAETNRDGALVVSVQSLFLVPTDYSPPLPETAGDDSARQFEIRIYTTLPGKRDAIDARFRDHTLALFERHGMTHLPYFHLLPAQEEAGAETTLLYFLVHESDEARKASFAAFRQDADWIAAREASERDGPILIEQGVASRLLRATDYSPLK